MGVGTRRVDRAAAEAVPRLRLQLRRLLGIRRLRHLPKDLLHLCSFSSTGPRPAPSFLQPFGACCRVECKQEQQHGVTVRGVGHEPEGESELRPGQVPGGVQRARLHPGGAEHQDGGRRVDSVGEARDEGGGRPEFRLKAVRTKIFTPVRGQAGTDLVFSQQSMLTFTF